MDSYIFITKYHSIMKRQQCIIVLLIQLVIFANVTEAKTQKKQKINRKGKGISSWKANISPINYWNPEGKSKDQIHEAYYCVKRNLWKEVCCYHDKGGTNKGTRDLFKVQY